MPCRAYPIRYTVKDDCSVRVSLYCDCIRYTVRMRLASMS
jgi:hypothetical protein